MITPASTTAGSETAATATAAPTDAAATPFDAIMALESLGATVATLEFAGLTGAAAEGECIVDLSEDPTDETDEEEGDEAGQPGLAGSLDWLAALLAMPAPTTSAAPTVPLAAGEPESQGAGDAPLRIAGEAVSAERESAASPPTAAAADGGKASLELAASKLLPPLVGTESGAAAPVAADQEGDSSLQPAVRGAEWFSQAVRQASAPERHAIVTHARDPRWAEEFGVRIALMVRGGESAASLQLSPVDLGPLEVSITVRESQASIHFGAAQAETRSLIEASIPRLREMLAAQGFHLMDASVSQGFARQAQSDGSPAQRRDLDSEPEQQAATRVTATGLLDTYA